MTFTSAMQVGDVGVFQGQRSLALRQKDETPSNNNKKIEISSFFLPFFIISFQAILVHLSELF